MQRFHYNHPNKKGAIITAYYVDETGEWFAGKGCHMKALKAWGSVNPHRKMEMTWTGRVKK